MGYGAPLRVARPRPIGWSGNDRPVRRHAPGKEWSTAVVLNDQLLVDERVHLASLGKPVDGARQAVLAQDEPLREGPALAELAGVGDGNDLAAAVADGD